MAHSRFALQLKLILVNAPASKKHTVFQALAGIIKGRGRALNLSRAGKSDEPISKILPLQQDKGHKDNDDSCLRER
jgi:hypothetical protein